MMQAKHQAAEIKRDILHLDTRGAILENEIGHDDDIYFFQWIMFWNWKKELFKIIENDFRALSA